MILTGRSSPETVQRSQQSHTQRERKSITEDLITVSLHRHESAEETRRCCVAFRSFHHSHYCFLHTLNHTPVCNKFRHFLWGGGGGLLKGILGNVGTTCTALNINCLTEEHFAGCLSWLSVGQERRKKTVKVVERSKKKKKHLFGSFHRWTGWTGDRWWCHDWVWGEDRVTFKTLWSTRLYKSSHYVNTLLILQTIAFCFSLSFTQRSNFSGNLRCTWNTILYIRNEIKGFLMTWTGT